MNPDDFDKLAQEEKEQRRTKKEPLGKAGDKGMLACIDEGIALQILDYQLEVGINAALRHFRCSVGVFFKFLNKNAELMNTFLSNQQIRAEVETDEIVHISDFEPDIDRARVRISARQWFGSRILPRKYGDKLSVEHTGHVDIRGSITDAQARAGLLPDIEVKGHRIENKNAVALFDETKREEVVLRKGQIVPYDPVGDSGRVARITGIHVPPKAENEHPLEWAEKLIEKLPPESRPGPVSPDDPAYNPELDAPIQRASEDDEIFS